MSHEFINWVVAHPRRALVCFFIGNVIGGIIGTMIYDRFWGGR